MEVSVTDNSEPNSAEGDHEAGLAGGGFIPVPSTELSDVVPTPLEEADEVVPVAGEPMSSVGEIHVAGVQVLFPHAKPYRPQQQMMVSAMKAMLDSKHALLESPTGTGKSIALLSATLAFQLKLRREAEQRIGPPPPLQPSEMVNAIRITVREREEEAKEDKNGKKVKKSKAEWSPSRAWGEWYFEMRKLVPQIFFASRTHSQLQQLCGELRSTRYKPMMTVLGSKEHLCTNEEARARVREHPTVYPSLGEHCRDLCDKHACTHRTQQYRLSSQALVVSGVWDIEELVELGKQTAGCAYYTAHERRILADIVFCPYNYLIDAGIREAVGLNGLLTNAVVVIDEAHNIEGACREAAGCEITSTFLQHGLTMIRMFLKRIRDFADLWPRLNIPVAKIEDAAQPVIRIMQSLNQWLMRFQLDSAQVFRERQIRNQCRQFGVSSETATGICSSIDALLVAASASVDWSSYQHQRFHHGQALTDATGSFSPPTVPRLPRELRNLLSTLMRFITGVTGLDDSEISDFCMCLERQVIKDNPPAQKRPRATSAATNAAGRRYETILHLWCLNPAVTFRPLAKMVRTIVLASGTLSPMRSFASELGTQFPYQMEGAHVVSTDQVFVASLGLGLPPSPGARAPALNFSYQSARDLRLGDALGQLILQVCRTVPHGVLVFFPSYSVKQWMADRWRVSGLIDELSAVKQVMEEPRNVSHAAFERAMELFASAAESSTGALLLAVCRGKVSEGMDFKDNKGRAVIVVGIPHISATSIAVAEKREYNTARVGPPNGLQDGQAWYFQQAFRALNQCIGRVIRHRHDFGAILLVDNRFYSPNNTVLLSKWIRRRVRPWHDAAKMLQDLGTFLRDSEAKHPVPPPSPQRQAVRRGAVARGTVEQRIATLRNGNAVLTPPPLSPSATQPMTGIKRARSLADADDVNQIEDASGGGDGVGDVDVGVGKHDKDSAAVAAGNAVGVPDDTWHAPQCPQCQTPLFDPAVLLDVDTTVSVSFTTARWISACLERLVNATLRPMLLHPTKFVRVSLADDLAVPLAGCEVWQIPEQSGGDAALLAMVLAGNSESESSNFVVFTDPDTPTDSYWLLQCATCEPRVFVGYRSLEHGHYVFLDGYEPIDIEAERKDAQKKKQEREQEARQLAQMMDPLQQGLLGSQRTPMVGQLHRRSSSSTPPVRPGRLAEELRTRPMSQFFQRASSQAASQLSGAATDARMAWPHVVSPASPATLPGRNNGGGKSDGGDDSDVEEEEEDEQEDDLFVADSDPEDAATAAAPVPITASQARAAPAVSMRRAPARDYIPLVLSQVGRDS